MYLSCHISVLSEIWVYVKDNVRTMNPILVTYFSNHACLTEGVPSNSSNFRVTFYTILLCDMTNALVNVFRFFNFTVFIIYDKIGKINTLKKIMFFLCFLR